MVLIYSIETLDELESFKSKFNHVILRFGAPWCSSCDKSKQPINEWINKLNLQNVVLLDINIDTSPDLGEMFNITKLPTFYCQDKFIIIGTDIEKIKSSILLLGPMNEDF